MHSHAAVRARRGGARGGRARPDPDPGAVPRVRGRLPARSTRSPAGSTARSRCSASSRLDRGDPQLDPDRGRDDRGRGRRVDVVEDLRERLRHVNEIVVGAARPRVRAAAGRRRSSGSTRRSRSATGSPSRSGSPAAGSCSARGRPVRRDDLGRGPRGRPGDPRPDALRLRPRRTVEEWARTPTARRLGRATGGPGAAGCSRSTARRTSRGPARGSSTASSCSPSSSIPPRSTGCRRDGRWRPRRLRRRPSPIRSAPASTASGVARPGRPGRRTTSRAGRSCARHAWARRARTRSCGSGCGPRSRRAPRQRRRLNRRPGAAAPGRRPRPPAPAQAPRRAATLPARRRAFPDDWFLRRGDFALGALHDTAWDAELDVVRAGSTGQPLSGRIEEPAAGTGFFSPLLADKGELHASDPDGAALDLARDRLVAHRLRAHLHVADPWAVPDGRASPARTACSPRSCSVACGGAGLDRHVVAARAPPARRPPRVDRAAAGPGRRAAVHDRVDLARPGPRRGVAPAGGLPGARTYDTGRFFRLVSAEAG